MPSKLLKFDSSLRRFVRRLGKQARHKKGRSRFFETLERRDMLAAAIWHNAVHPLDVSGDQPARVTPIDALLVINWLNDPSQERRLPRQIEQPTSGPYVDVNCDGWVTPLDALTIINHLNQFGGAVVGGFSTDGGSFAAAACSPQLREGTSFVTELERTLRMPADRQALELKFEAPDFDANARHQIRDAFEVQIIEANGQPVSNPLSSIRTATFNWTEGREPIAAGGVWVEIAAPGQVSTLTFDLSEVPAGTDFRVVTRLINNDSDNDTSVIVRGYEFVPLPTTPPPVSPPVSAPTAGGEGLTASRSSQSLDLNSLNDVSGLLEVSYGRTSLNGDKRQLISQATLTNVSNLAVLGPIVAVFDNFSDPNVFMMRPDGLLPDGRAFMILPTSTALATGQWIAGPEIQFRNDAGQRFQYRLSIFGKLNAGPVRFDSQPITSIEAGQRYIYSATAEPSIDLPLSYRVVSGPEGLNIDPQSGQVIWQTQTADVGAHKIVLRATDEFGMFVEQTFELQVLEVLPNRPPMFVSSPETEAVAAGAFDVITLPAGSMPAGLAVGNFGVLNGASSINELSLVAINQGSQTLSLIPGLGRDGVGREIYGPVQTLSVGEPPRGDELFRSVLDIDVGLPPIGNPVYDQNRVMGIAMGDFNGDGNLDVATSIVYQYRSPAVTDHYERRIAITLGNGDGTFAPPTHLTIPGPVAFASDSLGAISLRAHDFDGDGKLDLLVSETKGKKLLFYRGTGDGSFAPAIEQSTGTDIAGFKVADLNGNSRLDLVAIRADGRAFGVLLGNGNGSFQPYAEFSTHTGDTVNHNFTLGDLNGDGLIDFVSGNHSTRSLNIYLGIGDGTFSRGLDLPTRGVFSTNPSSLDWPMAVAIGDFSGNGRADIAYTTYANSGFGTGYGGGIALYEGDGSGTEFSWSTAIDLGMSLAPINIHGDAQPVDLNGDGHLDLVFTGPGEWGNFAPGVNVALNDGTGKFTSTFWIDSNLGTHPQRSNLNNAIGVLVGDFNNDGLLDLLTARGGRQHIANQFSSVSLMLADSPGTYRASYDVRAQSAMWGTQTFVEYADFNNDGILDIWGPAYQNPSFTQLGNGDGTFQPAITATPYIGNEGLGKGFVADLDLDGNMDIVWYGGGGVQGGPQGRYLAALGNGDGTFQITFAQTGNNTPSGYAPLVIKPADFDGDGYMDFVAITGLNTIEIMRNVAEVPGTFTRSFSVPFGASSLRPSIAAGDFDGDGIPDVIAVREQASRIHDLLFYKGIGDGTLAEPVVFPFAPDPSGFHFPQHIAVGDLNGDGNLDFVTNASYNRSAVVLGNGDGTFQTPMVYRTGTFFGGDGGLHLVDLNGDGILDLVSGNDEFNNSPRSIEIRLGLGDGTFGNTQFWGTSEGVGKLVFGDLDNDGRLDIGFNGSSRQEAVATFLGNRQGLAGVLTTDINGNGRTDILAINHDNSHVKRLINDGQGNFNRLHDLLVGAGPVELLSGDFNSNGRTDFLTINRSGRSISVMLADGLGGFARTDVPIGRLPVAGVLAKVTGGEHDDLLVIDAQLNALFVLTHDGTGAFSESALVPLGDKPSSIAVGDVDGDGGVDVIISLAESNRLMILRSLGSGQFADPTYVNLPAKPGKIAAGDLNGDGLLDLAVTFPETGEVALLLGMGQSRFTQPQRIRVGSQPDSIVMADANGDGLLDILVTNAGDNTASVILNRFDPNQLYRYDALAIDPDDDPVTYSILEGPGGMILNATTGEIRWAPMGDQIGTLRVVLEANDGRGGRATQEFSISVEAARTNATPVITTLPASVVSAEHAFTTTVSATDPDGDRLRYRLVDGPEGASIDPVTGQIDWDPRGTAMQMNREVFASGIIQLPHTAAQNVDSVTVEGWFRFASTSGNQVLVDKALNWNTPSFFTLRYFTGNLQLLIGNGTSAGVETLSIARTLPTEEWIHLSATFDDTSGVMALLVNGVQVASRTTTKRIGVPGNNIPLWVGQEVYPFHGDVYGFRLWNTARPASQIMDGMHQQLPAVTPNLVVDLRFNEGDSLSVINQVNPNHRGLISGTVVPKRIVGMAPLQTAQFTVSVEDGKGGFDQQTFSVTVAPKLPGSITGTLFSDDNRDGSRQAGEALLPGWTLFIDQNNNGYRDIDEPLAVTNASGVFSFNALLEGDYKVAVEPRAELVVPAVRSVSVVSQQVTTSIFAAEPLSPGQIRGRLTQANPSQPLAHQQVFADLNGNGLWDDDEPTTTTDAQGRYAIGGLATGNYSLRVQTQAAWQVTQPTTAAHDVALASNDLLEDIDFVIQPSNSIAAAAPQIVTSPPRTAVAGQPYRYAVSAISHDGRPIVYSLSLAPAGMVIDSRTGQIAWTPTGKQTGSHQVIVRAAIDNSHVDLQAFFVDVALANTAPVITSSPASPASIGHLWSYLVIAQDAEQSDLVYSLSAAPNGATIDSETGLVRWTPSADQIGTYVFAVLVHDNAGAVSQQLFTIDVVSDVPSTSPFIIRPPRDNASLLTPYLSRVSGVDSSGQPLTVSLISAPDGLTLDASGFLQWSPMVAQLGVQSLSVRFSSATGSSEEHTYSLAVRQTIGNSAPRIPSTPSSLFAVAGQLYAYDLLVNDADNDALSFELVTAPTGMSIHPQLGTLRWLPTLDQLGQSSVTIRVTDPQGGSDSQSFTLTTRRLGGPPLIQSVPPTQAAVGIGYLYTVQAVDAENDPLTYSLLEAPAGMTINSRTGEIAWTPTAEQLGQQSVFIVVSDASGNRATQGFAIQVAAGMPNRPPVITSQPDLFATVGENYRTTLLASDPEGSGVVYSLRRGPVGMSIDSVSGLVNWTPTTAQAGRAVVTLVATDTLGGASVQSFEIDVLAVNTPPEIISTPPALAWARGLFQYDVIARDIDRDPNRYEFVSSIPNGMTIDPLGRIRWQTRADDVGSYSVTVRASDPRGGQATQQIDFEVRADNLPPKVTVLPRGGGWPWDGPVVVFVSAVDNVGVVDVQLRVNGQVVPLDANRTARLSFDDWGPGVLSMEVTARDAAGNVGTATATAFYRDPEVDYESGEGLPVAAITTPTEDATVYGMVQIVGTAIGGTAAATGFKEYRLSYARADQLQFTEFVHSTAPVSDGPLGVWDTTLLENDAYVLRLEVVSQAGNTSVHEMTVGLSGNLKLGNFRLSFEDLTIPVAGIPITIIRTYDTLRSDRDGDFGYGWRLEYRNTDLRVSLPKSGLEDLGIFTPFRSGTKIFMTLPGGERVGWTFTPEFRVLPGWAKGNDLVMASPRYTPDRGNTATLSAGSGWLTVNQFGELYATGGMPWNPASPDFGGGFTVTLADGTRYFIDGTTGLMQTAADRNGNTLTFSDSGITSSLGDVGISIARDRHGRITSITDPAGNAIRYGYSASGDLASVSDRTGRTTRMQYRTDRLHFLESVINPAGEVESIIEYDQQGRMTRTRSVVGGTIEHDIDPHRQTHRVVDTRGGITLVSYDELGNPTSILDARGGLTQYKYDINGRLSEAIDALDRKTLYTSDAWGNVTKIVDAAGLTTINSYDSAGRLLATISPSGLKSEYVYDTKGSLTNIIDPSGVRSTLEYRATGKVTSVKQGSLPVLTNQFDSSGNRTGWTDFYGNSWSANFDPLGRLLSSSTEVETDSGLLQVVQLNEYDRAGRLTRTEKPDGSIGMVAYDDLGNIASRTYGTVTSRYQYNSAGQLLRVTHEDGSSISRQYDELGNLITYIDEDGYVTRWEFDLVGNLIAEIYPDDTPNDPHDNPRVQYAYDLANRLISKTDSLGHTTYFYYDARDLLVSVKDPASNLFHFGYDLEGRKIEEVDPLGRKTRYEYDLAGNVVRIVFPDGSTRTQQFDLFGRIVAIVDENGIATRYARNDLGQVLSITDGLGVTTRYEYDWQGNISKIIDGLGRETLIRYDVMGREISRVAPGGQTWTTEYDDRGNISKKVNPDGDILTISYDHRRAVTARDNAEGSTRFTYSPAGRLLRAETENDTIVYQYNTRGDVSTVRHNDDAVVFYQYDANGRISRISSTYSDVHFVYDSLGRISTATDHREYTAQYFYDAVGNTVRVLRGDSIEEIYEYDSRNRLLSKRVSGDGQEVLSFQYTLDPTGRVMAVDEMDRRLEFQYDHRYQLLQESEFRNGVPTRTTTYAYDAVGNRLAKFDSINGVAEYQYDLNDRQLSVTSPSGTANYQYNQSGSLIRKVSPGIVEEFQWDSDQRLVSYRKTSSEGTTIESYTYDPHGNLATATTVTKTTKWLRDLVFARGSVLVEWVDGDTPAVHIHGARREIVYRGEDAFIPVTDRLGTVRVHLDSAGTILNRYSYDAYGVLQGDYGSSEDTVGYAGGQHGTINSLVRMGVRLYDPELGRFISSDPHPGFFEFPQSLHKYSYVHNDPLNAVDPTGLYANFNLSGVLTSVTVMSSLLVGLGTTLKSVGAGKAMDVSIYEGLRAAAFAGAIGKMVGTGKLGVALLGLAGVVIANDMSELVDAFYDPEGPTGEPLTDARKAIALGPANAVAYVTGQIIETALFMTAAQRAMSRGYQKIEPRLQAAINDANSRINSLFGSMRLIPQLHLNFAMGGGGITIGPSSTPPPQPGTGAGGAIKGPGGTKPPHRIVEEVGEVVHKGMDPKAFNPKLESVRQVREELKEQIELILGKIERDLLPSLLDTLRPK